MIVLSRCDSCAWAWLLCNVSRPWSAAPAHGSTPWQELHLTLVSTALGLRWLLANIMLSVVQDPFRCQRIQRKWEQACHKKKLPEKMTASCSASEGTPKSAISSSRKRHSYHSTTLSKRENVWKENVGSDVTLRLPHRKLGRKKFWRCLLGPR